MKKLHGTVLGFILVTMSVGSALAGDIPTNQGTTILYSRPADASGTTGFINPPDTTLGDFLSTRKGDNAERNVGDIFEHIEVPGLGTALDAIQD